MNWKGEIAAGLAGGEAWRICEAARAWAKEVRAGAADEEAGALAEALAPLAGHRSAEVRQEVADAGDLFPEERFAEVIARLSTDTSHYVAIAAARAAKRRAARRKERARVDEDITAMAGMLEELEKSYDPRARKMAEELVRRGRELFTLRMHHEVSKAHGGLEIALGNLSAELEKPRPDRDALKENAAIARARMRHLWSIAERARTHTTMMTPRFKTESLRSIVDEAIAHLVERVELSELSEAADSGSSGRARKLDLRVDVEEAIAVDVDRGALLQAIGNALQNAVEAYRANAKKIVVEVRGRTVEANSRVELAIADRGVGMDEALMRELFVPFGSHKPGGHGVGMMIVRKMIEEVHGGTFALASAPGKGTTVTIRIPREQSR